LGTASQTYGGNTGGAKLNICGMSPAELNYQVMSEQKGARFEQWKAINHDGTTERAMG